MDAATSSSRSGTGGADGTSLAAVASRLHAAAIHLLRRLRAEDAGASDAGAGITPARLSALSVLVFRGPCSISELAAAEQVAVPTMSRLVAALEKRGLVTRRPDPSDGRAVRLEPSREGRRMLEEGRDRRLERLAALLSRLEREEVETVARSARLLETLLAGEGPGDRP